MVVAPWCSKWMDRIGMGWDRMGGVRYKKYPKSQKFANLVSNALQEALPIAKALSRKANPLPGARAG